MEAYRKGGWQAWLLPFGLVATATWQIKVLVDYNYRSGPVAGASITLAGSILAALPLLASRLVTARLWRRVAPGLLGLGLLALVVAPTAWSITPAMAAGNGTMPQAGPSNTNDGGFGGGRQGAAGMPGGYLAGSGLISDLEASIRDSSPWPS